MQRDSRGALGSGPAVSAASALAHEVVEQTAKQVLGLEYERAHTRATAAHRESRQVEAWLWHSATYWRSSSP
jgi:hypothetical protein